MTLVGGTITSGRQARVQRSGEAGVGAEHDLTVSIYVKQATGRPRAPGRDRHQLLLNAGDHTRPPGPPRSRTRSAPGISSTGWTSERRIAGGRRVRRLHQRRRGLTLEAGRLHRRPDPPAAPAARGAAVRCERGRSRETLLATAKDRRQSALNRFTGTRSRRPASGKSSSGRAPTTSANTRASTSPAHRRQPAADRRGDCVALGIVGPTSQPNQGASYYTPQGTESPGGRAPDPDQRRVRRGRRLRRGAARPPGPGRDAPAAQSAATTSTPTTPAIRRSRARSTYRSSPGWASGLAGNRGGAERSNASFWIKLRRRSAGG